VFQHRPMFRFDGGLSHLPAHSRTLRWHSSIVRRASAWCHVKRQGSAKFKLGHCFQKLGRLSRCSLSFSLTMPPCQTTVPTKSIPPGHRQAADNHRRRHRSRGDARQLVDGLDVVLWEGSRLVRRLPLHREVGCLSLAASFFSLASISVQIH
jgi:hypothetical protein